MLLVRMKNTEECQGMNPEMEKLIPVDRHIILRISDRREDLYFTIGTHLFTHIDMCWVDYVLYENNEERMNKIMNLIKENK